MKKIQKMLVVLLTMVCFLGANTAYAADSPEAYMGFSVSEEWYVFSKDMTDQALLDAVGMTAEEVNETLVSADCQYIIKNPTAGRDIQVRIKKNDLSYELYNVTETADDVLKNDIDRILTDGFGIEGFSFNREAMQFTTHLPTKFIVIPGSTQFEGKTRGMILGVTFVNGSGITFTMYLEQPTVASEDIEAFYEVINSVDFTVIKEKGSEPAPSELRDESVNALSYISGGLGGLALVALCYYMIIRLKRNGETEEKSETKKNNDND